MIMNNKTCCRRERESSTNKQCNNIFLVTEKVEIFLVSGCFYCQKVDFLYDKVILNSSFSNLLILVKELLL